MSPVWILKRLVSVFINACRLLSALPSLSKFGRRRLSLVAISFYALSLLFGPCRLSEFTLGGPQSQIYKIFQTLIWRPGEMVQNRESPRLSRRVDSTAKVCKIWWFCWAILNSILSFTQINLKLRSLSNVKAFFAAMLIDFLLNKLLLIRSWKTMGGSNLCCEAVIWSVNKKLI